jgi:hypothetical protein
LRSKGTRPRGKLGKIQKGLHEVKREKLMKKNNER